MEEKKVRGRKIRVIRALPGRYVYWGKKRKTKKEKKPAKDCRKDFLQKRETERATVNSLE